MSQGEAPPLAERRDQGDRRRYNRRGAPDAASPPYYEVFERIALALESIDLSLRTPEKPARTTARPRQSSES